MNNNTHVYGNMINIYIVLTILTLYSSINIILSTSMRGGIEIPKKNLLIYHKGSSLTHFTTEKTPSAVQFLLSFLHLV